MNSYAQSRARHSMVMIPMRTFALLSFIVLFVASFAPQLPAQTLMMRFGFEDSGVTTTDSVSGVVLSLTNNAGASADLHGAVGTGVSGIGEALDFTSSPANNTAACVATTLGDSTINFGTISSFTVTMWIKPTGTLNFARLFCLAANGVTDNGAANSLGIQPNNSAASVQATVNAVNTTVTGQNIANNQWTFLAYTYDGSTISVYSASEGKSVVSGGSIANAGGSVNIGSVFSLWLGNRPNRTRGLPAYYDDVRFYTGNADTNFLESVRKSVLPDPNVTATVISPASAPIGARVLISASSGGTAPLTNQWIFTDTNGVTTSITDATNNAYVIPSAQTTNAGTYRLVISNGLGSRTNSGAILTVIPLAGAGVTILDLGQTTPVPQSGDISQLQSANVVGGGNAQDGLNYYADSTPGQTFTTGSNPNGYIINGIYLKTAGLDSSATATAKTYTLRLYSISSGNATLVATYVTSNSLGFADGDWLLYSGGFTNILQPNTTYAYTHHQNGAGWDLLAYNNDGSDQYSGGEMTVITAAGGAATLGASHLDDAAFDVALSPTPTIPVISQQPASQTVTIGQSTGFSVGVLGVAPSYQWYTASDNNYSSPHLISGATSSTYSIGSPTLNDATNYFVVVNGGSSSVTSSVATLTVRLSVNSLAWLGNSSFNWDLATANWSNTVSATSGVLYQTGDNVQFNDAGKSTSAINLTAALAPTSVNVFSSSNYIFAGPGNLAGNVQLSKSGTGTLTISNANTFRGATVINNGTLRLANAAALGTATNSVSVNGGTLDFGGIAAPASLQYDIQGAGYTNAGALANSGGGIQNANGVHGVNLLGDASIGATGRWDLYGTAGSAGLHGNNHNLTKVGTGQIFLIDGGPNNQLADINILNGTLGFQGTNDLGDPTKTLSVLGSTLAFFGIPGGFVETKNIVLSNAFFSNSGGAVTLNAPINLLGTNTHSGGFQETAAIISTFNGPISGNGGWIKNNPGQDIFAGTNTYSGPTFVNSGILSLSGDSSLGHSSLIQIGNASVILDYSGAPQGMVLGSGQTLAGLGTPGSPNIFADITSTGATLSPGIGGAGSLVVNGNLTESGDTNLIDLGSDPTQLGGPNDYIGVGGNLTLSGINTVKISPIGQLNTASPYTIMTYGGTLAGGSANIHLVSGNPRYTLSVINPASTPNMIQVSVSGVATPLIWKGGDSSFPNVWNHSVSNFQNTVTSTLDQFYDGDLVTFDDTSITNIVNVNETNAPGLMTLSNNIVNYTFAGSGNLAGTVDKEGSATVTLAVSNSPAFNYITNNQGAFAFNLPVSNAILNAAISDNGGGLGAIVQNGTNRLVLSGDNSGYSGAFIVNNGVLTYTTIASLGGSGTVYVTNGAGTLNIGNNIAVTTGGKSIHIAGAGFNGQGAIAGGAGGGPVPMMTGTLTLDGDATIAANLRWDFAAGSTLVGNGFTLTKTGPADIWLISANNSTMGDAHIVQGLLGFQQGTSMGDPVRTITVESNATCGLWANAATFLDKHIVLNNGGNLSSGGDTNTLLGILTLVSNNTLTVNTDLHLEGPVVGTGGFSKVGAAVLYLDGTNTYTGNTTIGANSIVAVGANSSLGSSATIEIDGGSTLDVTAPPSLNLGAGQTIIGNGSILGGAVNFGSGSTLSVGFTGGTSTLNIFGNLILQPGSTNVVDVNKTTTVANDKVSGLNSVTIGGTLAINYLGNSLAPGDAIQLFAATTYSGSFASIVPATPGSGLKWDTSTLTTDGTLRVVAVSTPHIGTTTISGTNIVLSGAGGTASAGYTVLGQTNLAQPLNNWTVIGTGVFDNSGNFLFTNGITPGIPSSFYLIRMP